MSRFPQLTIRLVPSHNGQVMQCNPSLIKIFVPCFLTYFVEKYVRSIDIYNYFFTQDYYFMLKMTPQSHNSRTGNFESMYQSFRFITCLEYTVGRLTFSSIFSCEEIMFVVVYLCQGCINPEVSSEHIAHQHLVNTKYEIRCLFTHTLKKQGLDYVLRPRENGRKGGSISHVKSLYFGEVFVKIILSQFY